MLKSVVASLLLFGLFCATAFAEERVLYADQYYFTDRSATPTSYPWAGYDSLYVKNNILYMMTSAGAVTQFSFTYPSCSAGEAITTTNGTTFSCIAVAAPSATPTQESYNASGYAGNSSNNLAVVYFSNVMPGTSPSVCYTVSNVVATGLEITMVKKCSMILSLTAASSSALYNLGFSIDPTAAELDANFSTLPINKKLCNTGVLAIAGNTTSCSVTWIGSPGQKVYLQATTTLNIINTSNFQVSVLGFD